MAFFLFQQEQVLLSFSAQLILNMGKKFQLCFQNEAGRTHKEGIPPAWKQSRYTHKHAPTPNTHTIIMSSLLLAVLPCIALFLLRIFIKLCVNLLLKVVFGWLHMCGRKGSQSYSSGQKSCDRKCGLEKDGVGAYCIRATRTSNWPLLQMHL